MPTPHMPSFMNVLRGAGYATMLAGKDHLSRPPVSAVGMDAAGVDVFARAIDKPRGRKNA